MKRLNQIRGVLFDFDGTLTCPSGLDFAAIRAALGCPDDETVLEFIEALPEEQAKRAQRILEDFELRAATEARPNHGAENLIKSLKAKGLPLGIITRNRYAMVVLSLANFRGLALEDFAVIVCRDDGCPPKPEPDGIRLAAQRMGIPVERLLMVGDFRYDIEAGKRAGALTVLLTNGEERKDWGCSADFRIERLEELWESIDADHRIDNVNEG
jgi:hydrogenase expression/formation protein HypE